MLMFSGNRSNNLFFEFFRFFDLLYHSTVKEIRKSSASPVIGLFSDILNTATYLIFFIIFIKFLGIKNTAIRGSEIMFVMTGVFLFLVHIRAVGAVMGTKGVLNTMNLHTHVTTYLTMFSSALSTLYLQAMAFFIILYVTHTLIEPAYILRPSRVFFAFVAAWISGISVGYLFLSLATFLPKTMKIVSTAYQRMNMICSGKMILANSLPTAYLPFFDWNPLFHAIDQARDAAFVNYTARVTDLAYPFWVALVLFVLGMLLENRTKSSASLSWHKRA